MALTKPTQSPPERIAPRDRAGTVRASDKSEDSDPSPAPTNNVQTGDLRGEDSPGVVERADLVGVERDGLAGLVAVVGAVGRHAAGRREGEEGEERRGRGRRGRHRSRRAALTRGGGARVWGVEGGRRGGEI